MRNNCVVSVSLAVAGALAACGPGGESADLTVLVAPPTAKESNTTAGSERPDGGPDGDGTVAAPAAPPTSATIPRSEFEIAVADAQPVDAALEWQQPELALGDPSLVGDTVLIYNYANGLQLTALDFSSGTERWAVAATASAATWPTLNPLVIDQTVVTYLPTGDGREATVVGLDVATGEQKWIAEPGFFEEMPMACGDDASAVCLDLDGQVRQLSVESGEQMASWDAIGSHVVGNIFATTGEEQLEVRQYGPTGPGWSFVWNEVAAVEPDPSFGPTAWDSGVDNVRVMAMMTKSPVFGDSSYMSMLAVDTSTGAVLWTEPNRTMWCAGTGADIRQFQTARCRIDGALDSMEEGETDGTIVSYVPTWPERIETIEVFDPKTGDVLQSVEAASIPAWDGEGDYPWNIRYGYLGSAIVIQTADGVVVVDPSSGEIAPLPIGAIVWCESEPGDDDVSSFNVSSGFQACDPAANWHEPQAQLPPLSSIVGVAGGDMVAFVHAGRLEGYRVG